MPVTRTRSLPPLSFTNPRRRARRFAQQKPLRQVLHTQGAPSPLAPYQFPGAAPSRPRRDPRTQRIGLPLRFALIGRAQREIDRPLAFARQPILPPSPVDPRDGLPQGLRQ